jgi:hypothetical protein
MTIIMGTVTIIHMIIIMTTNTVMTIMVKDKIYIMERGLLMRILRVSANQEWLK